MTTPLRIKAAASRASTPKREQDPNAKTRSGTRTKSDKKAKSDEKTKSASSAKPAKARTRGGAGTAARGRSAAVERAYARRDRALRDAAERRPQQQRQTTHQRVTRQRVVPPRARQLQAKMATSRVSLVVSVMLLLVVGLMATLWLAIATVSGSYRLQQGESEINALHERKEQLMRQVSTKSSTPAVQRHATELGMVPAPEPAHLVVNPDGLTRVVGEPKRAQGIPAPRVPAPQPQSPAPGAPDAVKPLQHPASPVPAVEGR